MLYHVIRLGVDDVGGEDLRLDLEGKEKQKDKVKRVQQQEGRVKCVKRAIVLASNVVSNVASIKDPVSHISGSVLPAHKSIRVVNEIVCNKRLASPYRDVPRPMKQKLEDAFSRSIDETWNDNEEASSSMNI
ncbi:hypothetical protein HN51_036600 [Arachis hypogaea]